MANTASDLEKEEGADDGPVMLHRRSDSISADSVHTQNPAPALASQSLQPVESQDPFVPPDGGLVAWSQLVPGIVANALSWGYPAAFGVYQLHYKQTTDWSSSQISWIGSIQTFLVFFVCGLSGRLTDAGFVRSTTVVGVVLAVFGTFMTSLATQYWQFILAQGVCTGIGLGLLFMPAVTVLSTYFKRKRAFLLALAATGTSMGGIAFPAAVQYLIPTIGFPWAVRVHGFIVMGLGAIAIVMLRPRLQPRKTGPFMEWGAFKEMPYLLYAIGAFFFFWALYFGFFYINTYARTVIGFETTSSIQLLLITNAMGIPARILSGWLADYHIGAMNTYIIGGAVVSGMIFAWMGVHDRPGIYVYSAFYGFAVGGAQGVFIGSLASLTPNARKLGTRVGMVITIAAFASLAGGPTAGAIIDSDGGRYRFAQMWGGLVFLTASTLIAAARFKQTGFKIFVKI